MSISIDKKLKVREIINKYRETFETALELEEDDDNWFDVKGLSEALKNTDLQLSEDQHHYLVWLLYQHNKDVTKLKKINLEEPHNNVSLSSIKEEKYSKDESQVDRNSPNKIFGKEPSENYSEFNEEEKNLNMSEDDDQSEEVSEQSAITNKSIEKSIAQSKSLKKPIRKSSTSINPPKTMDKQEMIERGIQMIFNYSWECISEDMSRDVEAELHRFLLVQWWHQIH